MGTAISTEITFGFSMRFLIGPFRDEDASTLRTGVCRFAHRLNLSLALFGVSPYAYEHSPVRNMHCC
jgi:hypothetical protein